jgi:hypothetical protein
VLCQRARLPDSSDHERKFFIDLSSILRASALSVRVLPAANKRWAML